jgi:Flp pilus assembly protein TadD
MAVQAARTAKSGKKAPKPGARVAPTPSPAPERQLVWRLCACLGAAVLLVYWRALSNGFLNFDDPVYVYTNEHVKTGLTIDSLRWAFTDTSGGNWHPLTWISHMIDVDLFGLNAGAHHLISILSHAANSSLLLMLLWRMTGKVWRSALVAALFALHPLRVESVAWVAERKDVLSTFWFLCLLLAYRWYSAETRSWRRYLTVSAMLLLGLMSKPSIVTAPFVLLLLDYWPLARKERWTALVLEKLPWFGMAAAVSLATYVSQKDVGAMTAIGNLPFAQRLSNAIVSYPRYLGKIFFPHDLAVMYPYARDLSALAVIASCALLSAITAAALSLARTKPYIAIGWFWFVGTMVPMIGIVQVGWQAYADRYTYIPAIGIAIAVVWAAADAVEARRWQHPATIAAAGVLTVLALVTWTQLPYWRDDFTLFQHALACTSENPAAEYHLGGDYVDQGRNAEAIPHLKAMVRMRPTFYAGYYMLGKAQAAVGDVASATASFTESLRLNPDYAEPYYGRATMEVKTGDTQAAEADYRLALKHGLSAEWTPLVHDSLGVIAAQRRDMPAAVAEFREAVRLKPDQVGSQRNLAQALADQGRVAEAIAQLQQALAVTHGDSSLRQMLASLQARR